MTGHKRLHETALESEVQESEQRFRDLVNSLPQIVFETDELGMVTFYNHKAFESLGYSQDDIIKGMHISQILAADDEGRSRERIPRILRGEDLGPIEYTAKRKDGSTFPIFVHANRIVRPQKPAGMIGIAIDISEEKRLQENMQFYISEITKAQEEERRRISRELHDETAQSLAALSLDVERILILENPVKHESYPLLEQLRLKIDDIIRGIRRFSHELRPEVLDQLGLLPALGLLSTELSKSSNIRTRVHVIGHERRLPNAVEVTLFRITQEALGNVRRHSQATKAAVTIVFEPQKVKLIVIDDGRGFAVPRIMGDLAGSGKLGIIGMRERARLLGGSFSVKSEPGKGTQVTVELSLQP